MKKNMVLKDNIVAIEIKRFTRASSRGSSEEENHQSNKKVFIYIYIFFVYFYFFYFFTKNHKI